MLEENWLVIAGLAAATFTIRFAGYALGQALPDQGPWARGLRALPGCLILSLVSYLLLQGGIAEWGAGVVAAAVAILTRSLPLTMITGIAAIWFFRTML